MRNENVDKKFIELLSKVPNVAIQGYNKDRVVIYWNKASEVIYGYTTSEALGQKLEDLIIPEFMKNDVIHHVENWYKNGVEIPAGELPLQHKDGSTVYVYSSHVMLGEGTDTPEMFCIDIDLSKNKEQERLLQLSNIVVENSPVVLFRWKAKEGWPVEYVSKNVTMFGYSPEDLQSGKVPYADIVHPEDLQRVAKEVQDNSEAGVDCFSQEYRIVTPDGEVFEIDDRTVIERDLNGKITHYQGTILDITERKKAEKEKEKQMLMQSKIAAIGEMIGNIAHQWRQPLSMISTSASMLIMNYELNEPPSKEEVISSSDSILKNTEYLSKTIDDFRTFFNADSSITKEFNVKDALNTLHDLVYDSFKNNFIECVPLFNTVYINNNENQLIQALLNICNNAKDAMVSNNVNTDKRYFFVSATEENNNAVIRMRDSGGGISNEIKEKIFDPYFTTKHASIGTGLGLYMTHQIITKQYNGSIEVENVEYEYNNTHLEGVEFTITLPLS